MELEELLAAITPADQSAMDGCRKNWDAIAKPLNGLGHLGRCWCGWQEPPEKQICP